ncbi:McrC family protein [Pontibacter ramchanderi]|uniref:5-methylcytosine-specific restriction enzyme subunit McrC n=1 Tax=Pontibacter ramchanderi TaxID=1179743 RepID=A0A2N3V0Y2_9BACT|nr:restriction endonuclease [Pontibacter ramchanderi]PKV75288.1 5-methylcytosine-specific restriction enzyme subunit McrC [Pontibacter ramchanderi]
MLEQENPLRVFEHSSLWAHKGEPKKRLTDKQLQSLQAFHGEEGVPYYTLIHRGVRFTEYVGVLQVGGLTIEVLPKADKNDSITKWHGMLIGMLKAVGLFNIQAPTTSDLSLRSNSILDLYFALYLQEVEYLLHRGLVKKYRKTESNATALKGSIQFAQHIQKNLVHQERFYVRHTTYDVQHQLHQILYKTLLLLKQINTNTALHSKIGSLLLNFPEQQDLKVSEATFEKITLNRKTESYSKALEIARMLLLNYHPDVSKGQNHVLALMFDMNMLWERFVYVSLRKGFRKANLSYTLHDQVHKYFWKPTHGSRSKIKPDIVINKDKTDCVVLDTKWKNLNGYNPSPDDLRQLYVYHQYYHAKKVALVYPGGEKGLKNGKYLCSSTGIETDKECSIITLPVQDSIDAWQKSIFDAIYDWSGYRE